MRKENQANKQPWKRNKKAGPRYVQKTREWGARASLPVLPINWNSKSVKWFRTQIVAETTAAAWSSFFLQFPNVLMISWRFTIFCFVLLCSTFDAGKPCNARMYHWHYLIFFIPRKSKTERKQKRAETALKLWAVKKQNREKKTKGPTPTDSAPRFVKKSMQFPNVQ